MIWLEGFSQPVYIYIVAEQWKERYSPANIKPVRQGKTEIKQ